MTSEEFPDYGPLLGQVDSWPRGSGDIMRIWEMTPNHAIAAYHKLRRWAAQDPTWSTRDAMMIRRTPLAMSLLRCAVQLDVLYADDVPAGYATPPLFGDESITTGSVSLEACFDALAELDRLAADDMAMLHPVTRARVLQSALNTHP